MLFAAAPYTVCWSSAWLGHPAIFSRVSQRFLAITKVFLDNLLRKTVRKSNMAFLSNIASSCSFQTHAVSKNSCWTQTKNTRQRPAMPDQHGSCWPTWAKRVEKLPQKAGRLPQTQSRVKQQKLDSHGNRSNFVCKALPLNAPGFAIETIHF